MLAYVARGVVSKTGYLVPSCSSYFQSGKLCPALLIHVLAVHDFVPAVFPENLFLQDVSAWIHQMDLELLDLGHDSLLLHDVTEVVLLTAFPLKHPSLLGAGLVLRREKSTARTATAGTIQFSLGIPRRPP